MVEPMILENAQTRAEDQRRFRRYNVSFPCMVKPKRARKVAPEPDLTAQTLDISSGGIFLFAAADWSIGTEIECELRLPVKAFAGRAVGIRCRCKVARIVPQPEGKIGIGATIEHYEFFHLKKAEKSN